ncbi:hypothetical protein [Natronoarchaeum rubrum]|uniref:hypothetical protein n=1 Tax=Natronoarchaeum rubrum TaxID=755311 RepID=UPI0021127232|nr:hypothetical protein [Natronoarchaeum rubrum]
MSNYPGAAVSSRLTPAQRKSVLQVEREVAELYLDHDTLVFVLGSFDDGKKHRLENFCGLTNSRPLNNAAARLMDEFLEDADRELQSNHKFKVLALHADAIVGVAEDDQGGFVMEQGILVDNPNLLDKTYLLRRNYGDDGNREKYCWMQNGFFTELNNRNQVYDWGLGNSFDDSAREVLDDLGL